MSRSTPEWIGKTDDTPVPARVRLRLWDKAGGRCQSCNRKIMAGEAWEVDHVKAVINGGENRESNFQVLCSNCHKPKTRADVAEKARTARKRKAHLGIKSKSRPIPGSRNSPFRKRMDGTVERRT